MASDGESDKRIYKEVETYTGSYVLLYVDLIIVKFDLIANYCARRPPNYELSNVVEFMTAPFARSFTIGLASQNVAVGWL